MSIVITFRLNKLRDILFQFNLAFNVIYEMNSMRVLQAIMENVQTKLSFNSGMHFLGIICKPVEFWIYFHGKVN